MANAPVFIDDQVKEIPKNILNTRKFDLDVRSYAGRAPFKSEFRGELF